MSAASKTKTAFKWTNKQSQTTNYFLRSGKILNSRRAQSQRTNTRPEFQIERITRSQKNYSANVL